MVRNRLEHEQVPLGELLFKARQEKRLSRAQMAEATGISENSLVRYEKAGIEPDGQYPPSPKLAALCFYLGISPLRALFGCLPADGYWRVKGQTWEFELLDHPDFDYLSAQYIALLQDNRKLSVVLRILLDDRYVEKHDLMSESVENLKEQAREIIRAQEQFHRFLESRLGVPSETTAESGVSIPGHPDATDAHGNPIDWSKQDYRTYPRDEDNANENGPDQEDPDRPETTPNNQEAVNPASTNPPKERTD